MSFFYEIRSADNALLKRDGGFATQDAAKIAGREDAKKIKNSRQPGGPSVGSIMVCILRGSRYRFAGSRIRHSPGTLFCKQHISSYL